MRSLSGKTIAALLVVYVIWGSTYLAIRFAIETMPTFLLAAARFFAAGAALYLWGRWRGGAKATLREHLSSAAIGGCLLLGGNGLVVWAEHRVASGIAALLIATEPLWIAVLSPLFIHTSRPGPRAYVGIALGIAGVGVLVAGGSRLDAKVDFVGAAAVLLSALSWATGSLLSLRLPRPSSSWVATGLQMFWGGALLLVASGVAGEWSRFSLGDVSTKSALAWLYLTIFGSIVAYTAYTYLLAHSRPTVAASYAFVNPLVAVFLGWLVADEPLSSRIVFASILIIGALAAIFGESDGAARPQRRQRAVERAISSSFSAWKWATRGSTRGSRSPSKTFGS